MDFLFTGIARKGKKEQVRGKQGYQVQGEYGLLKIRAFLLNISYYQRNANQDYNRVSRHTNQKSIIKKSTNKRWKGCGGKETILYCWWKCKSVQPLWRTVWRVLKQLKIELSFDLVIPLLSIFPEKP